MTKSASTRLLTTGLETFGHLFVFVLLQPRFPSVSGFHLQLLPWQVGLWNKWQYCYQTISGVSWPWQLLLLFLPHTLWWVSLDLAWECAVESVPVLVCLREFVLMWLVCNSQQIKCKKTLSPICMSCTWAGVGGSSLWRAIWPGPLPLYNNGVVIPVI